MLLLSERRTAVTNWGLWIVDPPAARRGKCSLPGRARRREIPSWRRLPVMTRLLGLLGHVDGVKGGIGSGKTLSSSF
jgi:hypothetical protein